MLAELTLEDWQPPSARREPVAAARRGWRRLRIVQIFMQGFIDAGSDRAGAGDGGGLATLLVHLSAALAARPEVGQVTTLTRAFAGEGVPAIHGVPSEPVTARGEHRAHPLRRRWLPGHGGHVAAPPRAGACPGARAATSRPGRRGPPALRRRRHAGGIAGVRTPRSAGLLHPRPRPSRPDPQSRRSGTLDRHSFVAADRVEHLLFRARLVERMRDRAAGLALLPARRRARGAAGPGAPARACRRRPDPHRARGDLDRRGRRGGTRARGRAAGDAVADLAVCGAGPPASRHGLPLILSVGRLHRVKGFATLFEAWAGARAARGASTSPSSAATSTARPPRSASSCGALTAAAACTRGRRRPAPARAPAAPRRDRA